MKRSIKHLPIEKQRELEKIVLFITEKYDFDMVILFGSYARGDFVNDKYIENGTTYEYTSDYDLLIVVEKERDSVKIEKSCNLKRRIKKDLQIDTPANIIYHGIDYLNESIRNWNYFFNDILKEGIRLHHSKKFVFARPKQLFPIQRQQKAQTYFDTFFKDSQMAYQGSQYYLEQGKTDVAFLKKSIFELHQATEKYYMTMLMVYTDYRPKTHDLDELKHLVCKQHGGFKPIFPLQTTQEKECYQKLKKAYIDSRYKVHYTITTEEIIYLSKRVKKLENLTKEVCQKRILEIGKE